MSEPTMTDAGGSEYDDTTDADILREVGMDDAADELDDELGGSF